LAAVIPSSSWRRFTPRLPEQKPVWFTALKHPWDR
jgi:hypothetical protein